MFRHPCFRHSKSLVPLESLSETGMGPWCSCPIAIALENTATHAVGEEELGLDTFPAPSFSALCRFESLQGAALTPMLISTGNYLFSPFPSC